MTTEEPDVYRKLQQTLDQLPIGFPAVKSGVEIKVLKHIFTPEEAELAIRLKFSWYEEMETVEQIYERVKDLNLSIEELEERLDTMAQKGAVMFLIKDGKKTYGQAMLMIGIFEFQVDKITPQFHKDMYKYLIQGFSFEAFGTKINQLRTVPVEESLTPEHNVAKYNDVIQILKDCEGPFVVQNCVCRQGMKLIDRTCKVTDRMEVCMGFGTPAQMYIDLGWGREISREEAIKIIRKNEEDGLVLQPGNAKRPEFICSCCGCCCELLQGLRIMPRAREFIDTIYYAEVNADDCTGCETCISRCQTRAIALVDDIAFVTKSKCIGCGNCVPTCPSDAMQLKVDDREMDLPETLSELYVRIEKKKNEMREKALKRQQKKEARKKSTS